MRASEFLTENPLYEIPQDQLRQIADVVKRDCQPYLSQIGGNVADYALFRGFNNPTPGLITIHCPVNRKPKDTGDFEHKFADNWLFKKSGIKYRSNALFCTGEFSFAENYGPVHVLFPIGEFKYCWAENYLDMTDELDKHVWSSPTYMNGTVKDQRNIMQRFMDSGGYVFDQGLTEAMGIGNEIMLHGNCYALNVQNVVNDHVLRELQKVMK